MDENQHSTRDDRVITYTIAALGLIWRDDETTTEKVFGQPADPAP